MTNAGAESLWEMDYKEEADSDFLRAAVSRWRMISVPLQLSLHALYEIKSAP